jgi:CBS domain-containing protein
MSTPSISTAREFMNRHVHTVVPELPLSEVVATLLKHRISNAPVVDENSGSPPQLLGFVSERDCLEHLCNELFYGSPAPPQTAGTMMRRHPVCVSPDTDIFALTSIFENHGYRHLPVVEDGRLLGIVSRRDVLAELDRRSREVARTRERLHEPPDLREIIKQRFHVTTF